MTVVPKMTYSNTSTDHGFFFGLMLTVWTEISRSDTWWRGNNLSDT